MVLTSKDGGMGLLDDSDTHAAADAVLDALEKGSC